MGLFDRFKKRAGTEPAIDEKKLKEVAEYRLKDHQLIRDLQVKTLGSVDTYIEGRGERKTWKNMKLWK